MRAKKRYRTFFRVTPCIRFRRQSWCCRMTGLNPGPTSSQTGRSNSIKKNIYLTPYACTSTMRKSWNGGWFRTRNLYYYFSRIRLDDNKGNMYAKPRRQLNIMSLPVPSPVRNVHNIKQCQISSLSFLTLLIFLCIFLCTDYSVFLCLESV